VNENCRFQPWFRRMKALLEEGVIGEAFYACMHSHARGSLSPEGFSSQPFFAEIPRLVIYELGVHYLDTLRYLFGEALSLYCRSKRVCADISGEELAVITVEMNGLTAVLDLSWASIPAYGCKSKVSWGEYTVEGTRGTLHVRTDGLLRLITDNEEKRFSFPEDSELLGYRAAQAHFIDCLRNGSEPETSGSETLKTMELVFGSYDSAAGNRVYQVGSDLERLE
ncbi:MAG: Gfo/Idh/MocA family oxidoreductase, partial [Spirochaetaceae bacterium]|nr:Gfo/Idh/MocA family oxidoreductase [Spirochaetaceae bacterium]